ncbi:FkbM family methyltransferase [Prochlorococcus marinus]|uniref:FkbM family methyltransferase n=1 Tax=Prochlorococcus marinus TaxID=1219 RepID=UPI000516095D|nr:FkbM family methyltransferase [Prochlorococcus marinus]
MSFKFLIYLLKLRIRKIFFIVNNLSFTRFYLVGIYPSVEHISTLKYVLKESRIDAFLDIGSNKGQFTLAIKSLEPNKKIYSFDPLITSKKSFDIITKNLKNIEFFPFAISDICNSQEINIPMKNDSSSLLEISSFQKKFFGTSNVLSHQKVNVITLEHWFKFNNIKDFNNGFIKIDVQGLEINVLKGANDLLEKFKYIYIELSFKEFYKSQILGWEIMNFLENKKFKFIRSENCIYDKLELIQGDFLFKRI